MNPPKVINNKLLIGRNEWFGLPELGIDRIKGKIDTGAKTSAIHAFNIEQELIDGVETVFFDIHPVQNNDQISVRCQAPVCDVRSIMSSNGQKEERYVIETLLTIAGENWRVELTLSNRYPLRYRMLIGREALANRVLVDPSLNCHQKKF